MVSSCVARAVDFRSDWYQRWAPLLGGHSSHDPTGATCWTRKSWEFAAVAQALEERGMLQPGKTACGFAVGLESLPAAFAARGVAVLATDIESDAADAQHWAGINAHAASRDVLFRHHLVDRETFDRLVDFAPVDMRDLSALPRAHFDFLWSSCALEHLGSLERGVEFVLTAMDLLKPGGWAVHTTEYNVGSDRETVTDGISVIYRRRDIEALDHRLRRKGCGLEWVEFDAGSEPADVDFDEFPYFTRGRHHIKLLLDGHITTSMLLVIRKGFTAATAPEPVPVAVPEAPPPEVREPNFTPGRHHIKALLDRWKNR